MKVKNQVSEIIEPKTQTELFGYDEYFNYFVKLFENKNDHESTSKKSREKLKVQ